MIFSASFRPWIGELLFNRFAAFCASKFDRPVQAVLAYAATFAIDVDSLAFGARISPHTFTARMAVTEPTHIPKDSVGTIS